jgi:hypothetical protein
VLDRKGVPHFLRLDGEEGYLEPGAVVTMFPGNSGQAKGLVRAEDVRERMQSFLERTPGDDGMGVGQGQEDINGKRARALIKGLEKHGFEQVRLLDMALDRVPEKEKEKIELRKAKAQRGIDSSKTALNKARNKFHLKASSDDHGDTVESNHEGGNNRGPGGDTSFVRSENRPAKAGNASGTREKPENPGNSSGKETDNGGNRGDRPEKTGKSNKP